MVGGLATALMTARQGHDVTVLERDPAPPPRTPGAAWDHWERQGVPQFRQPHFLLPPGLRVLRAELPDVIAPLRAAGAAAHPAPGPAGRGAMTLYAILVTPADPLTLALDCDRLTSERMLPWYQAAVGQAAGLAGGDGPPLAAPATATLSLPVTLS